MAQRFGANKKAGVVPGLFGAVYPMVILKV